MMKKMKMMKKNEISETTKYDIYYKFINIYFNIIFVNYYYNIQYYYLIYLNNNKLKLYYLKYY